MRRAFGTLRVAVEVRVQVQVQAPEALLISPDTLQLDILLALQLPQQMRMKANIYTERSSRKDVRG